jgi:hypothetical protein
MELVLLPETQTFAMLHTAEYAIVVLMQMVFVVGLDVFQELRGEDNVLAKRSSGSCWSLRGVCMELGVIEAGIFAWGFHTQLFICRRIFRRGLKLPSL